MKMNFGLMLLLILAITTTVYGRKHGKGGKGMRGKKHGGELKTGVMEFVKACKDDVTTLCPGLKKKELANCMEENANKVSSECVEAFEKLVNVITSEKRCGRKGGKGHRGPSEKVKEACKDDVEKLCPDTEGRETMECMKKNHDQVSQVCKDAVKEDMANHHGHHGNGTHPHPPVDPAVKEACESDVEKFCAGKIEKDLFECMKENFENLSEKCSAAIKKAHPHPPVDPAVKEACESDVEKFCAGKTEKDLFECMKENFENLSEKCSTAIKESKKHRGPACKLPVDANGEVNTDDDDESEQLVVANFGNVAAMAYGAEENNYQGLDENDDMDSHKGHGAPWMKIGIFSVGGVALVVAAIFIVKKVKARRAITRQVSLTFNPLEDEAESAYAAPYVAPAPVVATGVIVGGVSPTYT